MRSPELERRAKTFACRMINLVMSMPEAKTGETVKQRILESVSFLVSVVLKPLHKEDSEMETVLRLIHRESCVTQEFLAYLTQTGAIDQNTSDSLGSESEFIRSRLVDRIQQIASNSTESVSSDPVERTSHAHSWSAS